VPAPALEPYRHAELAFTLDLPPELEVHEDLPHVALLAVERPDAIPDGTFRASLSVVAEDGPPGMDLAAYVAGSLEREAQSLQAFRLLDRDELLLDAVPAVRTLAHYQGSESLGVTLEQWRLIARGLGWVVTATSDAISYADKGEIMSLCAESFRVETAA
jgi:hypothetical protein